MSLTPEQTNVLVGAVVGFLVAITSWINNRQIRRASKRHAQKIDQVEAKVDANTVVTEAGTRLIGQQAKVITQDVKAIKSDVVEVKQAVATAPPCPPANPQP